MKNKIKPVRYWGFQAIAKLILFGLLAILIACYGTIHVADDEKDAQAVSTASIERGKALYEQYCLACHGATGKGDGPMVPGLKTKPKDLSERGIHVTRYGLESIIDYPHLSQQAISKAVRHGNETMPAQKQELNKQQIEDISSFLKFRIFKDAEGESVK